MSKILIVYDSVYGNTEQIALAIGKAFDSVKSVAIMHAKDVKPEYLAGLQLLIVGSPTQKFSPLKAVNQMLGEIPTNGLKGVQVAGFDTRLSLGEIDSSFERWIVKTGGYAAKPITSRLKKCGGNLVAPAEGFLVSGTQGPLIEGELDRATGWVRQIVTFTDGRRGMGVGRWGEPA